MEQQDLFLRTAARAANTRILRVAPRRGALVRPRRAARARLGELDVVLMRKDPLSTTSTSIPPTSGGGRARRLPGGQRSAVAARLQREAVRTRFRRMLPAVLVRPQRRAAARVPARAPRRDLQAARLDGGTLIFRVRDADPNISVIRRPLPQRRHHDHGAALHPRDPRRRQAHPDDRRQARPLRAGAHPGGRRDARQPGRGRHRRARALHERDRWICDEVGPRCTRAPGVRGAGRDRDYLTEINVTSPTCIREIDRRTGWI